MLPKKRRAVQEAPSMTFGHQRHRPYSIGRRPRVRTARPKAANSRQRGPRWENNANMHVSPCYGSPVSCFRGSPGRSGPVIAPDPAIHATSGFASVDGRRKVYRQAMMPHKGASAAYAIEGKSRPRPGTASFPPRVIAQRISRSAGGRLRRASARSSRTASRARRRRRADTRPGRLSPLAA